MHAPAAPRKSLVDDCHRVWDRVLRLFHWALVASITMALVSGFLLDSSWIRLHLVSGILAAILVALRIVWGFTGPTYARFSQFLPHHRNVVDHLKIGPHHARYIGHNPLGALMVFALLATVAVIALTGVALLGSGLKAGPLAFLLSARQSRIWSELHEVAALAILSLVFMHIAGVLFESWRTRENLVRSMVTGRKQARRGDIVSSARPARYLLATSVFTGLMTVAAAATFGLSGRALPSPPVATLPETYVEECAACHMPYHPSLRPSASWARMMSTLDDHFGEDASLPEETRTEIADWLEEHAAETVDNKPAMLWRRLEETVPVSLPETQAWQHIHASVDNAVFKRRSVFSRANCAACHRDYQVGWFSPFEISIPMETPK